MRKLIETISVGLLLIGLIWLLGTFGAADVGAIGVGELVRRGFAGIAITAGGYLVGQIGGVIYG